MIAESVTGYSLFIVSIMSTSVVINGCNYCIFQIILVFYNMIEFQFVRVFRRGRNESSQSSSA